MNKKLLFLISPIIFAVSIFINISSVDATTVKENAAFNKAEDQLVANIRERVNGESEIHRLMQVLRGRLAQRKSDSGAAKRGDVPPPPSTDALEKLVKAYDAMQGAITNLPEGAKNAEAAPTQEGLKAERGLLQNIKAQLAEMLAQLNALLADPVIIGNDRDAAEGLLSEINGIDNIWPFPDYIGLNQFVDQKITLINDFLTTLNLETIKEKSPKKIETGSDNRKAVNGDGLSNKKMIVTNSGKKSLYLSIKLDNGPEFAVTAYPGNNPVNVYLNPNLDNTKVTYSVDGGKEQTFYYYYDPTEVLPTKAGRPLPGEIPKEVRCNTLKLLIESSTSNETAKNKARKEYAEKKCDEVLKEKNKTGTSGTRAGAGGTVVTPGGGTTPTGGGVRDFLRNVGSGVQGWLNNW